MFVTEYRLSKWEFNLIVVIQWLISKISIRICNSNGNFTLLYQTLLKPDHILNGTLDLFRKYTNVPLSLLEMKNLVLRFVQLNTHEYSKYVSFRYVIGNLTYTKPIIYLTTISQLKQILEAMLNPQDAHLDQGGKFIHMRFIFI